VERVDAEVSAANEGGGVGVVETGRCVNAALVSCTTPTPRAIASLRRATLPARGRVGVSASGASEHYPRFTPVSAAASADFTRSGENGTRRMRTPVASKIALAIAAATGRIDGSPAPVGAISG